MNGIKPQNLALAWWVLSSASFVSLLLRLAWEVPIIFFFIASTALILSGAYATWGKKGNSSHS